MEEEKERSSAQDPEENAEAVKTPIRNNLYKNIAISKKSMDIIIMALVVAIAAALIIGVLTR